MIVPNLQRDEEIVLKSKLSIRALLMYWISVPSVLFLFFFTVIFPKLRTASKVAKVVSDIDNSGMAASAYRKTTNTLAVVGLVIVLILLVIWIIFCYIKTQNLTKNYLAITRTRVIGINCHTELYAPIATVKDIIVEQPLLGKLFDYGSITVSTKQGSITVHNIKEPEIFRRYFLNNQDMFSASGSMV